MQIVEIIRSPAYFGYALSAAFVTGTALAMLLLLTFISTGLLDIPGEFQAYSIPPGSQETLNKEMFFRNLKDNAIL